MKAQGNALGGEFNGFEALKGRNNRSSHHTVSPFQGFRVVFTPTQGVALG